jgi:coatomer subunit beta
MMLISCDLERAVEYFHQVYPSILSFDEGMQLEFVEMIRKDCRKDGADKSKYISTILSLLTSASSSVRFDAVSALILLTSHASAIKSAASCYIDLCLKASDNNVKLIVLAQISALPHECLEDLTMDILRIVASPDLSVRTKTLNLCIELTTSKSVQSVCQFLKKELQKTMVEVFDKVNEYRQLLIASIHSCALKYPTIAGEVVHVLMDFVSDSNAASQGNYILIIDDVISFVKEVMEKFPHMRLSIIQRLLGVLPTLKSSRVVIFSLISVARNILDSRRIP